MAPVPGIAFGGREASDDVDAVQVLQLGQVNPLDLRAAGLQLGDAAFEGVAHGGLDLIEEDGAWHCQAPLAQAAFVLGDFALGQNLVQQHGIAHATRNGAGSVQCGREWHGSFGGNQPGCAFEANQAIECSGNADGAPGVRAQSRPGGAAGDGYSSA